MNTKLEPKELLKKLLPKDEYAKQCLGEWPEPKKMIYVFARDYNAASLYARMVAKVPRKEWRYIDQPSDLHGVKDAEIHVVTTWMYHRNSSEIFDIIKILENRRWITVKMVDW